MGNNSNRPKVSFWKMTSFGYKTTMQAMPVTFIVLNIFAVLRGVQFGFMTWATQLFFDAIYNVVLNGYPIAHAYRMIIFVSLVMILGNLALQMHFFLWSVAYNTMDGAMKRLLHKKMSRIDPLCLEDTALHDDINKAAQGARQVTRWVIMGTTFFTYYTAYYIFMAFYLHHLSPHLILAIVVVFVPVVFAQFLRVGIKAKFEDKAAPIRREMDYYREAITGKEYFKETRLLGAYPFFMGNVLDSLSRLNKARWTMFHKNNMVETLITLINIAGYIVVLYMLITALLAGQITAGAFAAIFAAIGTLFWMMSRMINDHLKSMASDLGTANNFIRYMNLPEREGAEQAANFSKGIVATNISFIYPHARQFSIDDVSLEVKAGETIAIVGENGAGKTTLVRLLTGIYTPTAGSVTLSGMNTAEVNTGSLYGKLSGVFQKFQRYQMTLKENIEISRIPDEILDQTRNDMPLDGASDTDIALAKAGIDVNTSTFPKGIETMLSREFEGVDLSGGQWQRVAIARGLYRVHDTIVLDEPTAAIDPIEESRIYQQFIEISRGKTAIIVTHRLGSARIADRVIVMSHGKIVDSGVHDELIQRGGLYAEMYSSQAEWYE